MKRNEKTVKVKVKPKRLTRVERKNAKLAGKAAEQLELCRQAGEFHKAYLTIELERETAKYEALQARLAELQPTTIKTIETITEEEIETLASLNDEEFVGEETEEVFVCE